MVDTIYLKLTYDRRTQYPHDLRPLEHLIEAPPELNHIDFSTLDNRPSSTWYFLKGHQEATERGCEDAYLADRVLDHNLETAVIACDSVY